MASAAVRPAAGQAGQRSGRAGDPDRRRLSALLRWRARWLLRRLSPEIAAAARLAPVLLQASFTHPSLRKEPPGIVGGDRFRRAWASWARKCGLTPPLSMQHGRGLIDAVVALQREGTLEILVFGTQGLRPHDRLKVAERVTAARAVLAAGGRPVLLRLCDEGALPEQDREACLLFGALLAGSLPPALADERLLDDPQGVAIALAPSAPGDVAVMALMLLAKASPPPAIAALRAALAKGVEARVLASPDATCTLWVAPASADGKLLEQVLGWSQLDPAAPGLPSPTELLEVGQALALACAAAVRSIPLARGKALRRRLQRDVLGPGLPRVLLPLLANGPIEFEPAALERRQGYKVRLPGGPVLGHGRTLMQARVRALALRAAAQRTPPPGKSPLADLIEARLARSVQTRVFFLVVEHAVQPGPPFDPLNRGPERRLGLQSATAVWLRPGSRPSARRLRPQEAVPLLCRAALAGMEIEVVPLTAPAALAAARLLRVAAFARRGQALPVAIESGGEVLLGGKGRVRKFGLRRFGVRPVLCQVDPEAFDLALSPERAGRQMSGLANPGLVESRVYQVSDALACVLTCDSAGRLLREEIRLAQVEDHLRELREVLRAATPPAMLAVRLADQLETVLRMHQRLLPPLPIAVGGALPHGLWVEVAGERIDTALRGGWTSLAQAVLAQVQSGAEARISIERVAVTGPKGRELLAPLFQIYARSLVLRRLAGYLRRELSTVPGGTLIEC
jgi:hypothetical protein